MVDNLEQELVFPFGKIDCDFGWPVGFLAIVAILRHDFAVEPKFEHIVGPHAQLHLARHRYVNRAIKVISAGDAVKVLHQHVRFAVFKVGFGGPFDFVTNALI